MLQYIQTMPSTEKCSQCGERMRFLNCWAAQSGDWYNQAYYCFKCEVYHFYDKGGMAEDEHHLALIEYNPSE